MTAINSTSTMDIKPKLINKESVLKYKCIILFIGIGFVFSQKIDELSSIPIQGYTVSPNPGKLRIIANYNSFTSPEFFDDDGKLWQNGDVISLDTSETGDTNSIKILNFEIINKSVNLRVDYMGDKNVGVYFNAPITFARTINDIQKGENGLGGLTFGIYFLWEEYFKIQRIRTELFYKRAKSGLPGDFEVHYTGTGQNNIGYSVALDLLLSEKLIFSLKQKTTFAGATTYNFPVSGVSGDSIALNPSAHYEINSRIAYNIFPRLSMGVDYNYHSFATVSVDNSQSTGFISSIKPKIGFRILSAFNIGYLDIENLSIVGSTNYVLKGKSFYKPNILKIGLQTYFE